MAKTSHSENAEAIWFDEGVGGNKCVSNEVAPEGTDDLLQFIPGCGIPMDEDWETSTTRDWPNNEFADVAFASDDRKKISGARVTNESNPTYGTPGGNDTRDRIFPLSEPEVCDLLSKEERVSAPTPYAESKGQINGGGSDRPAIKNPMWSMSGLMDQSTAPEPKHVFLPEQSDRLFT